MKKITMSVLIDGKFNIKMFIQPAEQKRKFFYDDVMQGGENYLFSVSRRLNKGRINDFNFLSF